MPARVTITQVEGGIFQLAMDDAEGNNRLGDELKQEIINGLDALGREPSLKVVLLTGRKDVFCAGGSLDLIKGLVTGETQASDCYELQEKMLALKAPIVGALEGHAVGGGLVVALCCDVLVAAEERRYSTNFAEMGFTPGAGATTLLPLAVGHHFASEMLMTARHYKGKELKHRGIFNDVVPASDVVPVALDLCRRMATKPGTCSSS